MKTPKKRIEKSDFTKKIESVETREVEDFLLTKKVKDIKNALNDKNILTYNMDNKNCADYIKDLIKQKGFTIKKVISLAGMNESYGRKILNEWR